MNHPPGPAPDRERLAHLDVLRGLAVLGILAVNTPSGFGLPPDAYNFPNLAPLPFDAVTLKLWLGVRVAFEGKFIALFSMLFGVSVFLVGGQGGDAERSRVLVRRLSWLVLFGVVHGTALWFGDVLLLYALTGFAMILCRSWRTPWLASAGGILFLVGNAYFLQPGLQLEMASPEVQASAFGNLHPAAILDTIRAFRGNALQVTAANFGAWARVAPAAVVYHAPGTLGLMMIGLALFKSGLLQGRGSVRLYAVTAVLGAAAMAVIAWEAVEEARGGFSPGQVYGSGSVANTLLAPVATLGYIGLINLALRGGLLRRAALALAPVGRMAFTNYIAQSLVMTAIFYGGRGLGLMGGVSWPGMALLVLAVWAAQLLWSPLWLSRFTMGPLEWAWRRLSYRRALPLRRSLQQPAVPAA